MILMYISALISCTPTVYCTPEGTTATEESEQSGIPTPSQDLEDKEEEEEEEQESDPDPVEDPEEDPETTPVSREYTLDDQESLLYVQVFKDDTAIGSGFAHNHVMRATNWDGTISYSEADPSACYFDFIVPVLNLQVDEDAMRSYVGYGDALSSGDRSQIREHMLAPDQLDSTNHPYITFISTACTYDDDTTLRVTGEMTLVGTTKTVDLVMDFVLDGDRLYSSGRFDFNHADFNMTPYSGFFGAVRNAEELQIHWDMIGYEL